MAFPKILFRYVPLYPWNGNRFLTSYLSHSSLSGLYFRTACYCRVKFRWRLSFLCVTFYHRHICILPFQQGRRKISQGRDILDTPGNIYILGKYLQLALFKYSYSRISFFQLGYQRVDIRFIHSQHLKTTNLVDTQKVFFQLFHAYYISNGYTSFF